jgi:hypothetical protein
MEYRIGGDNMASKKPSYTTYEQRKAWMDKAYKRYNINLRYDTDEDLIDFIEANKDRVGTTQIIREALQMYVKKTEG